MSSSSISSAEKVKILAESKRKASAWAQQNLQPVTKKARSSSPVPSYVLSNANTSSSGSSSGRSSTPTPAKRIASRAPSPAVSRSPVPKRNSITSIPSTATSTDTATRGRSSSRSPVPVASRNADIVPTEKATSSLASTRRRSLSKGKPTLMVEAPPTAVATSRSTSSEKISSVKPSAGGKRRESLQAQIRKANEYHQISHAVANNDVDIDQDSGYCKSLDPSPTKVPNSGISSSSSTISYAIQSVDSDSATASLLSIPKGLLASIWHNLSSIWHSSSYTSAIDNTGIDRTTYEHQLQQLGNRTILLIAVLISLLVSWKTITNVYTFILSYQSTFFFGTIASLVLVIASFSHRIHVRYIKARDELVDYCVLWIENYLYLYEDGHYVTSIITNLKIHMKSAAVDSNSATDGGRHDSIGDRNINWNHIHTVLGYHRDRSGLVDRHWVDIVSKINEVPYLTEVDVESGGKPHKRWKLNSKKPIKRNSPT